MGKNPGEESESGCVCCLVLSPAQVLFREIDFPVIHFESVCVGDNCLVPGNCRGQGLAHARRGDTSNGVASVNAVAGDGFIDGDNASVLQGHHGDPAVVYGDSFWNGEDLVQQFYSEKRNHSRDVVDAGNLAANVGVLANMGEGAPGICSLVALTVYDLGVSKCKGLAADALDQLFVFGWIPDVILVGEGDEISRLYKLSSVFQRFRKCGSVPRIGFISVKMEGELFSIAFYNFASRITS